MVRCCVLHSFIHSFRPLRHRPNHLRVRLDMITTLLRAGARLDSIFYKRIWRETFSALYVLEEARVDVQHYPWIAKDDYSIRTKELIVGIQEDGSFKRFVRRPHRAVLRLRSLVSRGRALPVRTQRRRPRGRDGRQDGVVTFLCKLGDNGVVWKILEFWQATR